MSLINSILVQVKSKEVLVDMKKTKSNLSFTDKIFTICIVIMGVFGHCCHVHMGNNVMLKIILVCVGSVKENFFAMAVDEYKKDLIDFANYQ